jgi:hypothetical protein
MIEYLLVSKWGELDEQSCLFILDNNLRLKLDKLYSVFALVGGESDNLSQSQSRGGDS